MYRTRFTEMLDNLRHEYDLAMQENLSLKSHIKDLEDKLAYQLAELKQTKAYVKDLNHYITSMRRIPIDLKQEPKESRESKEPKDSLKKIKMGSDWSVEGDKIYEIKVEYQKIFYHNIQSVEISNDGNLIAIILLKNIFVLKNNYESLYFVNSLDDLIDAIQFSSLKRFLEGETNPKMCFSSDSKHLYTTVTDKIIRKWNLEEDKLVKKINIHEDIFYMGCSEDSLVALCKDAVIRIFNEDKVKEIPLSIKNAPVFMKIYQNRFYISMTDKKMVLLDLKSDELKTVSLPKNIHRFDVHENKIICCSSDESVSIWNLNIDFCEFENETMLKTKGRIILLSFIDNKHVLLASSNSKYHIINFENDACETVNGYFENIVALNTQMGIFCTASTLGKFRLWRMQRQT